jgi:hypothetical protein
VILNDKVLSLAKYVKTIFPFDFIQGIWTIFPYAVAASTALFFYVRRKYFS